MTNHPASQLQLASHPAIWQNVNLTQIQNLGKAHINILIDGQSASQLQLAANKPSDKMVNWPSIRSSGVSIFYINTHLTFCQMASQPASQQAIWQNVNLTHSQILGEVQVNIFLDGQSASQLQLASQPTIWQNINLTLSQILGAHLTKCQPNPKSHLGDSSSAMPCHFTHYIFQAFPVNNM